jgi:hypothetical protein
MHKIPISRSTQQQRGREALAPGWLIVDFISGRPGRPTTAWERLRTLLWKTRGGAGGAVTLDAENGDMSHKKPKRSRGPRGRTAPRQGLASGRMRIRLWPAALHWYVSQERLALYGGVRVHQGPDGAAFVFLPEVGEVGLEARQVASAMTAPGSELAAAVLTCDGAWDALIGVGETASAAIDEVLGAIEQAFVDEVGSERARSIAASVLTELPELADEQVARGALSMMVIGGPSW